MSPDIAEYPWGSKSLVVKDHHPVCDEQPDVSSLELKSGKAFKITYYFVLRKRQMTHSYWPWKRKLGCLDSHILYFEII